MSTTLLFGAGAFVTFITLWGVVMAGGLFATRHQAPDDAVAAPESTPVLVTEAVVLESERSVDPAPQRVAHG